MEVCCAVNRSVGGDFSAWVCVNGKPALVYGIKIDGVSLPPPFLSFFKASGRVLISS